MTRLRLLVTVGILFLVIVILVIVTYRSIVEIHGDLVTPKGGEYKEIVLDVVPGATVGKVCAQLEEEGIISSAFNLKLYYKLFHEDKSIKYGEYRFSNSLSPVKIMQDLINGRVILHRFTVPEGLRLGEVAMILEKNQICTRSQFFEIVKTPSGPQKYGISGNDMEGYLFPETYFFPKSVSVEEVVDTMVKKCLAVLSQYDDRISQLGFTRRELLTMASMIEEEGKKTGERPIISAVFHNRLKRKMLLQCDPTVIYAMGDTYKGRIRKKDLKIDSPYNTYMYPGLPPGPICSPGETAIQAAAYPAPVDYLYFVSKNDGTHKFSKTLKEHQKAVWKYQKRRKKR